MKNYVLFMVLAVLLFASACSEPMDTTVAHYEPTEKNQADFAELEQRLAYVNAAVAELTDETGCVAPENHEAALAAAEAYGKAAVDSGALLSCVREEGSVLFTLNSGYGVAYIPRLKGMLAGGGESSIVTFEPYKQDFAYSIAAGAGDFFTVSYYAEQMSKNKDLDAWRYDGIAANGDVTVAAAKNFKPGSCIFWQSHGGYLTPYGPIIFLGEKADLASTGYYAIMRKTCWASGLSLAPMGITASQRLFSRPIMRMVPSRTASFIWEPAPPWRIRISGIP